MPGSFGSAIWFLGDVLEIAVVVCSIAKGSFRRYLCLNLYMLFLFLGSIGRFQVLNHYGLASSEYAYFYFYSDALLTILLYFALITLYLHVFDEMQVEKYVRLSALLLLAGTAIFSYMVVHQSQHKMLSHFFFELSQNLYFVGLALTYVLWGAILKLRETRTQLIQLVLSLGLHFSALAATYAIRNLYPTFEYAFFVQATGLILPLAWAYAFWRLSPDARMAPSRLAVVPR